MIRQPDTSNFDDWTALWPNARVFVVFKGGGRSFAGSEMGSEAFNTKVGNWARFWATHLRRRGIKPSRLAILVYDEPHLKWQYDVVTAWAKAIKAAEPELTVWVDPQPKEPNDCLEMLSVVDVICPIRGDLLGKPPWVQDLFVNAQRRGKTLWLYNAAGPVRCFDPFSYFLLHQWHCFKIGAKGSIFWSFADTGRVSCWNEYPAEGKGPYCPFYLDHLGVTAGKYMEALCEGVQDYEYLTMLNGRIRELQARGVQSEHLARAKRLLATACDRVLAGQQGNNFRWDEPKDRTIADRVRIEVLQSLVELAEL
jgi:hypothetical protein